MLKTELKALIVSALLLEDIAPADIETDAPLFGEGLGLDSIDALELAMAIHKTFGVKIAADDDANKAIFQSVATLATHIEAHRASDAGEIQP
jgi:acyl carrier protein